ncbi:MAG: LysR substrate-binding domain-containing protein [Actinomycetales bacterium]|nr:LysR family transcriptional regulator [Leifsonia sp.]
MELTQLRAFVAASRERNIGRAAASLLLTPSPVSRTIRQLEGELGGDLFVREYHDLQLTALGAALLPAAVEALAQIAEVSRVAVGGERSLRIASTPWAPSRYFDQLRLRAGEAFGSNVAVTTEISSVLLHRLRHGDLDIAVVHLPLEIPGIASRPLARYQFSVFAHPEHKFRNLENVGLSDLAGSEIIMLPSELQPVAMTALRNRLIEAGIENVSTIELRDWVTLPTRLRERDAITLGSLSTDTPFTHLLSANHLISVPLRQGAAEMQLGIAWRANDQLNAEALVEIDRRMTPRAARPLDVLD